MQAEIISVGDELLAGLSANTNAAFIGQKLSEIGYVVRRVVTVADDDADIQNALQAIHTSTLVVIITGGLGPTHDDITKRAVTRYYGSKLIFRQDLYDHMAALFQRMGRQMSPSNRGQAEVPDGAEILPNTIGTAPGLLFQKENTQTFVLPGVPTEMRRLMDSAVLPRLRKSSDQCLRWKMLRTTGIPESELYDMLSDIPGRHPLVKIAFLPQVAGVVIRLTAEEASTSRCEILLDAACRDVRQIAGKYIFGEDETTIEEAVAEILTAKGLSIAVAESCTGGLISHKLTNVPGSSTFFNRGVVAYSNEAKIEILDVQPETIQQHGAVSPETALEMAKGVRRISGTDIGLSTTGIAGPGGGTTEKPVGLVYMGYTDQTRSRVETHRFGRDRRWNKRRTATVALNLVRRILSGDVEEET